MEKAGDQSPRADVLAPLEPEFEPVEIGLEAFRTDRALVGSHEPPFEQRHREVSLPEVNTRKQTAALTCELGYGAKAYGPLARGATTTEKKT